MSNIFMLFSEDSVFQGVFQTVADIQALQSHIGEDQFYQK